MLILTRRLTETLTIGDDITITVMAIKGKRVRIGISAPDGVAVRREEAARETASGQRTVESGREAPKSSP